MLMGLSLRLRIFLFFGLMAVGAAVLAAGAMAYVWMRADPALPAAPFITAFVIFAFLNAGLALGIWLLFDEHVARPIDGLSVSLRLRAHSGVNTGISAKAARYLGDLAPAAHALSETVDASVELNALNTTRETARLRQERERLTMLLSEIPIATILINPARQIVLYDAQAAAILAKIAPPRLNAPLADYFDPAALNEAERQLAKTSGSASFTLFDIQKQTAFTARLKPLGDDGNMIFIDLEPDQLDATAPRPLVFDFDLLNANATADIQSTALFDLCLVVFDTETTGLSVENDEIVQIAALRVLNGRIVMGEVFDVLVNPGRPIPPASSRIHGIRDADVADAGDIIQAGRAFHAFARDAVLVAHNAPFDIGLLRQKERQLGLKWDHPVLDTVLLSAIVFGTTADHSLDALCERLAITIPADQRHTALGDARATAEATVRLLPVLQAKGITTFAQLIQETQKHSRLLEDLNAKQ